MRGERTMWSVVAGVGVGAGVGAGLLASGTASAATTVYATGFEAPAFGLGQLDGQDDWEAEFLVDPVNAMIQGQVVRNGAQALEIDAAPQQGSNFWFRKGFNFDAAAGPETTVRVRYDTLIEDITRSERSDNWGVQVYDNAVNLAAYAYVGANNQVFYYDGATGVEVNSQAAASRGEWFTFGLDIDYATRTYAVVLNGQAIVSGVAIDAGASNFFGEATLWLAGPGNDTAWYDDFSITRVPTPSGAAVLAGAGLLAVRRRRG
jgi:hypothetical protein